MARKRKNVTKKKLAAVRHDQKRTNTPTEELHDSVSQDVQKPTRVLYPRNPDLDPQPVWHHESLLAHFHLRGSEPATRT